MQVAVPKGRSVIGLFYKRRILKKVLKSISLKGDHGLKGIKLLHDNAPCHRASTVIDFLKKEKVQVLPHPPYSPDLAL